MLNQNTKSKRRRAGRDMMFKAFITALYSTLFMCPVIVRFGSGAASTKLPSFTYTDGGIYALLDDGDGNWRVKFLTSGTLTLDTAVIVDAFLVGGGGNGEAVNVRCAAGAGGRTLTAVSITLAAGVPYSIVVGAGGTAGYGGSSSAFGYTANGGGNGVARDTYATGGSGGSGGAATAGGAANGGSDGSNGVGSSATGGNGQGTTTREFHEASGALYAGGGGASRGSGEGLGGDGGGGTGGMYGVAYPQAGAPNKGGGGGAQIAASAYGGGRAGGSGIVIIRNQRAAE